MMTINENDKEVVHWLYALFMAVYESSDCQMGPICLEIISNIVCNLISTLG